MKKVLYENQVLNMHQSNTTLNKKKIKYDKIIEKLQKMCINCFVLFFYTTILK